MVSTEHVSGTRGSGIMFSAADVLWMSVVLKSYLHNCRARVVVDNTKSKKILIRHGVPQGGVISPTLFLVFINDFIEKFPSPVKCAMYADDLVPWRTEEYATTSKIQEATSILKSWAEDWCYLLVTCGCSAASNWKPGPHAVSTIVKCLQSPGCC